ncbi:MAG: PKD domain-containing protein [Bacteroidetes bacterium]|nr:PKD domain-containing protein [Bacteroidota bacterium]
MKKILLFIMLWFSACGLMAQGDALHISGYVTDSITGNGVPDYPLSIDIDSTNLGVVIHLESHTNANGFYSDTLFFAPGQTPTGIARISLSDCRQVVHSANCFFSPGHLNITHDFVICTGPTPPPCHADFNPAPPAPPQNPLNVHFINTSVGANGPWLWMFGDGTTSTNFDPWHIYQAPGLYHVWLSMGDTLLGGCYDLKDHFVQVGDSMGGGCHADFSANPILPPLTMQFNNLSTGTAGSWFWSFGDGNSATSFEPHHTYAAPGLYQVSLSIGDSNTGCWDYASKMIHVGDTLPPPCQPAFTWNQDSLHQNHEVHFINQSTPENCGWSWNFGDSTLSNEKNPTHTFAANGVYNVCLTISNPATQCSATQCHEVHVGPPPPPPCTSWFSFMPNWLNLTFEGHLPQNAPATYDWTFGDGTAGTGKNIQHHFAAPGFYDVSLTTVLLDSNQCTFTSTQHIRVADSSAIHQVYGQVFAGNFPLLAGMAMIFSDDTLPGGLPFFAMSPLDSMGVYMFPYVPDGQFVIWAMPFDSTGSYLPTFYENALYWEQANKIQLGNPQNPYNIHLLHAGSIPSGPAAINGHVNTQGLKSANVDQITMFLTDEQGNAIGFRQVSSSGTFDFSGMAYGTYYLKPELPNTTSDQVKVLLNAANPTASVTMTYSGKSILGVSEASAVENFTAYPNPVKDVLSLNLTLLNATNATIGIYSFSGQKVLGENVSLSRGGNVVKLDVSLLNAGLYTLQITSAEGIRLVQKIAVIK